MYNMYSQSSSMTSLSHFRILEDVLVSSLFVFIFRFNLVLIGSWTFWNEMTEKLHRAYRKIKILCIVTFYVARKFQTKYRGFRAQRFYLKKSKFLGNEFLCFASFTSLFYQLYLAIVHRFYTIRTVFESSFQLCVFRVANLKKLWQFWQKCVDGTFVL